ncbi:glycosyl transferase family, a/b domain-containing protein [Chaetomium fimeti]|uniref:Glycosyl transferase family, a/b domain-containing protein n=1 Tax=Chaetomium fimeti TaxID=1854472 RepID=A0AAE0LRW5_9PEZI|nr:glycosyl transferase family, a/b domain-containing protein [Chaetomium fimeti]
MAPSTEDQPLVNLKPLLARLWPLGHPDPVSPTEIAEAISHFFTNQVSEVQAGSLLMCLHFTGLDRQAEVLAKTAECMLKSAAKIDQPALRAAIDAKRRKEGQYEGGLVDIVGTGGDSHNTFNISTTASIIASSLLLVAKHGNKASTSKSGSADLLNCMQPQAPRIDRIRPDTITALYSNTNYGFLFAPVFHPGMRHVAPIRKQLPWRTIFNLVGPLANPTDLRANNNNNNNNDAQGSPQTSGGSGGGDPLLEARVIGVARKDIGAVFAHALRLGGARKAMVVCGDEELDEISCAGDTLCWRLRPADEDEGGETAVATEHFRLHPRDFGLPAHPLSAVSPGKEPHENAGILRRILDGQVPDDDPILDFVLINAAALFVVSGICEADTSDLGHGDDGKVIKERGPGGGRWKEGVRRARWAVKSGEAARQWAKFVEVTNSFSA